MIRSKGVISVLFWNVWVSTVVTGFIVPTVPARTNISSNSSKSYDNPSNRILLSPNRASLLPLEELQLSNNNITLALWVFAFASSHIGMSATRSSIISSLGNIAAFLRLVGREEWTLPHWWPADSSGGKKLFPDEDTAGRQVYRALYTVVSFATLGNAFAAYLHSSASTPPTQASITTGNFLYDAYFATAALSNGAAIASLFNASPLGLMPGFKGETTTSSSTDQIPGNTTIGRLRRDDAIKFTARGLTRITRHPLILPVVPWGVATSYLSGNRLCDYILFMGLSLYALAGCAAQDLRVLREEGSVGTVFKPSSTDERKRLTKFFEQTSFVPFGAVLDGRQQVRDIVKEVPWLGFVAGIVMGVLIEEKLLKLLEDLVLYEKS